MFINKHFTYFGCVNSESKRSYNAKPLAYCFYMEVKVSVELHICIRVSIRLTKTSFSNKSFNICVNLHNSGFPSFNFYMFNEEDGPSLNNKRQKRVLNKNQRF